MELGLSIIGILVVIICLMGYRIIDLNEKNKEKNNVVPIVRATPMQFDEMNKIINSVFEEVKEKYLLFYILRELSVIPKMDQEIIDMTKEVMNAFSPEFKQSMYLIYSEEYVIRMITRKCQQFMLDYTDKHKPRSK